MTKRAQNDYPIIEPIAQRWSPRAFSDRPVDDATLLSLFEAARWAPSSRNEQPWRFVVGRRGCDDTWALLLACLDDGNQRWAQKAPVLVLTVASLTHARGGRPNRWAWHDVGLGTSILLVQATAMGLCAHPMAGYSADRARELFGIPEEFEPVTAIAVGYLGDPDSLPDDLRASEVRPRRRRPVAESIFASLWGQSATWALPPEPLDDGARAASS